MSEKENLNDVTLMDMIKAILKKWKALLCVTLAALILFGGLGVVMSFVSNQDYGADVEFYVSSEKANRYILSLLQSDSFAEELLMDDNGLPEQYKDTQGYKDAFEKKKTIEDLTKEIEEIEKELVYKPRKVSDALKASNEAQKVYDEIYNHLTIMYASADAVNYKNQIIQAENDLAAAKTKKDEAKETYNALVMEQEDMKEDVSKKKIEIEELKEEFLLLKDELLVKYRANRENAAKIIKIKDSITYKYAEAQDVDSQALLQISVAVYQDEKTAKMIVDKLPKTMDSFIADNVNQEVTCEYMSALSSVRKIDAKPLVKTTVKYGAIGALVVFFISVCIVVAVFLSKADKKNNEQK